MVHFKFDERPTPAPKSNPSGATSRMPDDVVIDQVHRLKLFGLISSSMWSMGIVMDTIVFPRTIGHGINRTAVIIELLAVFLALGLIGYLTVGTATARAKAGLGMWLMLLNASAIAMLETLAVDPTPESLRHLSWITVVILLSSMITPDSPRKMLGASLVSASMLPMGVWMAHLRGVDVPSVLDTLAMSIPTYACAIAAVMPSVMLHHLSRRLREARDLGSYHLVERLGQGGMGEVWRGQHRLLARDAAIKLVRPELLGSTPSEAQAQLRRFEREAQATARLTSPHSIRLFDYGATDEGSFYYVMELLDGRDLESLVTEFGPLPAERAMFLLAQACHSLGEAHARGLVHRDVKPGNLFACRMGNDYDFMKVLDFGLVQQQANAVRSGNTETLVTAERLLGTPAYMAPEIILGTAMVDQRADVYALGCVAYFLLTGKRVFEEGSQMQALIDHVHAAPVAPSRRTRTSVPRAVDDLVLACLQKDPDRRPQDANEILQEIKWGQLDRGWSSGRAQAWWQEHLPELSGPLTSVNDTPLRAGLVRP
ncbi:MAG: serine/threonine-protein kinase [Vicinamibacterales bacterium]